jgi:hypothetical protein
VFETRSPYQRTFAISELRYVHIAQDVCGGLSLAGTKPARWGSSALAGTGAVMTAVGWPVLHLPALSAVALAVMTASSVIGASCWRSKECPHELWAFYRGRFVCLYADPDRIRFAQVTRATKRLLEDLAEQA